jgi:hypothetical protein
METTLTRIDSTVWMGRQHSSGFSSGFMGSGVCKIEIQTPPSEYTERKWKKKAVGTKKKRERKRNAYHWGARTWKGTSFWEASWDSWRRKRRG